MPMHQRFRMFRNTLRATSAAMALALTSAASAAGVAASPATDEPYHVVHGWPQLPPDFALGQVSGVAVDSHNHVFVFHRAENSWATDKTKVIPSATVMCFDGSTGKLLSSWGQNRFVLPHGLRVDSHDHVWVTDLGLQQVLEFSHDGELLLTLGTERSAGLDGSHLTARRMLVSRPMAAFSSATATVTAASRSLRPTVTFCWIGVAKVTDPASSTRLMA